MRFALSERAKTQRMKQRFSTGKEELGQQGLLNSLVVHLNPSESSNHEKSKNA